VSLTVYQFFFRKNTDSTDGSQDSEKKNLRNFPLLPPLPRWPGAGEGSGALDEGEFAQRGRAAAKDEENLTADGR